MSPGCVNMHEGSWLSMQEMGPVYQVQILAELVVFTFAQMLLEKVQIYLLLH